MSTINRRGRCPIGLDRLNVPEYLSLGQEIAASLRDAILNGTLAPGEHLIEAAIAGQMRVSRAPVREAILALERQGLVVNIPRRGAYVVKWSRQDIEDIYTLRMVLEGMAARLAATRMLPEQCNELQGVVDALSRYSDVDESVQLDRRFHELLSDCTKHARLQEMLAAIQMQTALFIRTTRRAADGREGSPRLAADHQGILDAVRQGDPDVAEQRMRAHIESSAVRLLRRLGYDSTEEAHGEAGQQAGTDGKSAAI